MSPDLEVTDFLSLPEFTVANLPPEDRYTYGLWASIELSAWADACEGSYRRRISKLENYIATVRSLRNTCAPISRLPNEVLAHVFADSSLTYETHILCVCRRWRSVLLANPRFWARCISSSPFDDSRSSDIFLRAALKHSGALPISIELQDPDAESTSTIWDTLLDHHTRIAELTVDTSGVDDDISSGFNLLFRFGHMEKLHSLTLLGSLTGPYPGLRRPDWGEANLPVLRTLNVSSGVVLPYMVVASLTNLSLDNVHLTLTMLINILDKCPLLESLQLDLDTLTEEDSDIDDRAICLPQLREVSITDETTHNIARLLGLFKSQPFSTRTLLTLRSPSNQFPPIDYQHLFAPPRMHRTCIEPYGSRAGIITARTFSDSSERLRIKFRALDDTVESVIPPISVFIVNSPDGDCDDACLKAIAEWDLPLLQRLEISHMSKPSNKHTLASFFLNRFGHRAGELSLAWILPVHAKQEAQSLAEAELRDLLGVLRDHADLGKPHLGRLDLYAVERAKWEPFKGSIEAGSDARLCSNIVEPFLAELRKWVDVVHVG